MIQLIVQQIVQLFWYDFTNDYRNVYGIVVQRVVRRDEVLTFIKSIVQVWNATNRNMYGPAYNKFDRFNYHMYFFITKHVWTITDKIWKLNSLLFDISKYCFFVLISIILYLSVVIVFFLLLSYSHKNIVMDVNKDFWEDFIELNRNHSCLWNVKCKDYSNKIKRNWNANNKWSTFCLEKVYKSFRRRKTYVRKKR